jgi:lysophospholipase L1-like esterase
VAPPSQVEADLVVLDDNLEGSQAKRKPTAGAPAKSGCSGILNIWNLGAGAALFPTMLLSGLLLARPSLGQGVSPSQVPESAQDWSGMLVYRDANRSPWPQKINGDRVIFFGDSITQGWDLNKFFPSTGFINRGISGQTTAQMLVRFRQDVIALNPQVVVILAGTNDVAENLGPTTLEEIESNLMSMVDISEANGVRVVLSSILPAGQYPWRREVQPIEKIVALNNWIAGYSSGRGLVHVDYFSAMQDDKHWMKGNLSPDGVHPNAAGYEVMRSLAEPAILEALQQRRRIVRAP